MQNRYLHSELTSQIIKHFYTVYNTLGYGFLEKVYEKALYHELCLNGLPVVRQKPISVYYEDILVGEYFADLCVDETIIIEIKAAENLREEHELQLINYLKATNLEIGLLLNFGKEPEVRRKIFTNDRKQHTDKSDATR